MIYDLVVHQAEVEDVAEPSGSSSHRRWAWAIVAGYCLVFVVLATVQPPGSPRQEIRLPRGDDAVEVTLQDRFIDDGTITRAWVVDPFGVLGSTTDLAADGMPDPAVVRDVGGYDALVVYTVFPSCGWAPEIRAEHRFQPLRLDVRSRGDCEADAIRVTRAIAVEFSEGVDPAEVTATHRDP